MTVKALLSCVSVALVFATPLSAGEITVINKSSVPIKGVGIGQTGTGYFFPQPDASIGPGERKTFGWDDAKYGCDVDVGVMYEDGNNSQEFANGLSSCGMVDSSAEFPR